MDENTAKLIEQLAQKLGTTSEYLWRVLLKQAQIDATTNLIQIVLILLFGWGLYKIHRKLMKKTGNEEYAKNLYYRYEEMASLPMIIGAIVFAIMSIWSFFCISNIVDGYFSPEYWALNKIIYYLK